MDDQQTASRLARQIAITDHVELGRLIADWATGAQPLPMTITALRQQLSGLAEVGSAVREVEFVRSSSEKLVIRLPEPTGIEAACDALADPYINVACPLPRFYREAMDLDAGTMLSPLEVLHARLADHALAECP